MIEQKTPECTLGLTIDTLSAWRDGDLRSDEMERVRAHTSTCTACQKRLAGFAMVAHAFGRQGELEPGDRIWHGVQDRIASQAHGRSGVVHIPAWNWRGLAAVASLILVVGLLAYVLNAGLSQRRGTSSTSTATVATTSTVATTRHTHPHGQHHCTRPTTVVASGPGIPIGCHAIPGGRAE